MGYVIGMDEAGYGPNYGPLVITATCWHVSGAPWRADLYGLLGGAVSRCVVSRGDTEGRIVIGDSKALYKSGSSLARLETGVLAAATLAGHSIDGWQTLFQRIAPGAFAAMEALPWYAKFGCSLPLHAEKSQVARASERLRAGSRSAGVELRSIDARAVFAPRFNELLNEHGSKATALSCLSIALLTEILNRLDEPVLVICDKHGARNQYQRLLQSAAGERLVEVRSETRERSVYAWGPRARRVEVHFCARAEEFLQVALASMMSKYLRELAMLAFNRYWCSRVPNLRPTAGYPQDARRFRAAICDTQRELEIADPLLWRDR